MQVFLNQQKVNDSERSYYRYIFGTNITGKRKTIFNTTRPLQVYPFRLYISTMHSYTSIKCNIQDYTFISLIRGTFKIERMLSLRNIYLNMTVYLLNFPEGVSILFISVIDALFANQWKHWAAITV